MVDVNAYVKTNDFDLCRRRKDSQGREGTTGAAVSMKLWRRFCASWRGLSTRYRAMVGALVGSNVMVLESQGSPGSSRCDSDSNRLMSSWFAGSSIITYAAELHSDRDTDGEAS